MREQIEQVKNLLEEMTIGTIKITEVKTNFVGFMDIKKKKIAQILWQFLESRKLHHSQVIESMPKGQGSFLFGTFKVLVLQFGP